MGLVMGGQVLPFQLDRMQVQVGIFSQDETPTFLPHSFIPKFMHPDLMAQDKLNSPLNVWEIGPEHYIMDHCKQDARMELLTFYFSHFLAPYPVK